MGLCVADCRFVLNSDLEEEVEAGVLRKLHEERLPLLPFIKAADFEEGREVDDLLLFIVDYEVIDLLLD